jgi:ABC-type sugar transport system ATPase subunit
MRAEIKRLQLDLGITSIYVTHDQVEAMTMADRVAIMRAGHLQAYCPPNELYEQPRNLFIASFIGNPPMNFVNVAVTSENGDFHARREAFDGIVSAKRGAQAAGREKVILGIRPEDMTIVPAQSGDGILGEAYVVEPLGRDDLVTVHIADAELHALADPGLAIKIGDPVRVKFDPGKVQFFDPDTEESLLWA